LIAGDEDHSLVEGLVSKVPEGGDARLVYVDALKRVSKDLVQGGYHGCESFLMDRTVHTLQLVLSLVGIFEDGRLSSENFGEEIGKVVVLEGFVVPASYFESVAHGELVLPDDLAIPSQLLRDHVLTEEVLLNAVYDLLSSDGMVDFLHVHEEDFLLLRAHDFIAVLVPFGIKQPSFREGMNGLMHFGHHSLGFLELCDILN